MSQATVDDVEVRTTPAEPYDDPTMAEAVDAQPQSTQTPNRLVVIGDSVSHGVLSGAVWRTELTWPALLAEALGIEDFRRPVFAGPGPGLPINIETLVRMVGDRFGAELSWFEVVRAGLAVRRAMDAVEDYWERGPGSLMPPATGPILHNLASLGFDLRDALALNLDEIERRITVPSDDIINQPPEQSGLRAARVVFATASDSGSALTQLEAAKVLGDQGDPGIETLVVMLGANNALRSVTELAVRWSTDDGYDDLDKKNTFTVWLPRHFQAEWTKIVGHLQDVKAQNVVVATVPHVTVAPIARGVGDKLAPGSRYFAHYTRPWIRDDEFDPRRRRDPYIRGDEAREIDSAIDQYNETIATSVKTAREQGRNWLLFDLCSLLDRLAYRRYLTDPVAQPDWFEPYPLPPELLALDPVPDTRFFGANASGRTQGGLFSLDGIHPTTIGQGLIADALLKILTDNDVAPGTAHIDFARVVRADTLISNPPKAFDAGLALFGWFDQTFDLVKTIGTLGRA